MPTLNSLYTDEIGCEPDDFVQLCGAIEKHACEPAMASSLFRLLQEQFANHVHTSSDPGEFGDVIADEPRLVPIFEQMNRRLKTSLNELEAIGGVVAEHGVSADVRFQLTRWCARHLHNVDWEDRIVDELTRELGGES